LVDLKDPIQVHLLTETALSDSKKWEILSQEEVDDLKKQCQSLTQRITQTRANLAIQAKYRDAALSMAKLYSPASKRRSLLGNRGSGGETAREAEAERQACEKRCEELGSELFSLEKRLMEPQRRLLQHTAGILQLTHGTGKKVQPSTNGQPTNGIPGSPESLYTYTNKDRESFEPPPDDESFGENRNLFSSSERTNGKGVQPRKNAIEIPLKSPIRKETMELREEGDRLREENGRLQGEALQLMTSNDSLKASNDSLKASNDSLKTSNNSLKASNDSLEASNDSLKSSNDSLKASNDSLSLELDAIQRESDEQLELIAETEKKIEDLNSRLRDVIVRFNPGKNGSYKAPPSGELEPGDLLTSQLKYLDDGLVAVQEEQELSSSLSLRENEKAATAAAATLAQAEAQVEEFNQEIRRILRAVDPTLPPPPEAVGDGLDSQIEWLQDRLGMIEAELLAEGDKQKAEEMDAVLMGLWDLIQSGYATIRRQNGERRRIRSQKGLPEEDDDASGDESPTGPNETYSLSAFTTTIQWLYTQATKLREQKAVLKRQIKQQRELNTKSDTEKDAQLSRKSDELVKSERETRAVQDKLAKAIADLESSRQATAAANDAASGQLKDGNAKLTALEAESKDLVMQLSKVEAEIASLTLQLNDAAEAKLTAESKAEKAAREVKEKDEELDRLNVMVVELKTEATIAKAELEGAYGSRAQRAADVAELSKSKQNSELQGQVDKLRAELAGTLKEFEGLTKDTIAAEKEKLELEGKLDDAQASKTSLENESKALRQKLEAEIAGLKEELDAERLKVAPASGGGTSRAGASMLSEQFRATMKEERKKFQEEIRVSPAALVSTRSLH